MQSSCKRLVGLDVFRILSALLIFLFHSNIHIGCTYSIFTPFVNMGAIVMTGFFMLSGVALYSNYNNDELSDLSSISTFYKKRFISVVPLYYIVAFIYLFIYSAGDKPERYCYFVPD